MSPPCPGPSVLVEISASPVIVNLPTSSLMSPALPVLSGKEADRDFSPIAHVQDWRGNEELAPIPAPLAQWHNRPLGKLSCQYATAGDGDGICGNDGDIPCTARSRQSPLHWRRLQPPLLSVNFPTRTSMSPPLPSPAVQRHMNPSSTVNLPTSSLRSPALPLPRVLAAMSPLSVSSNSGVETNKFPPSPLPFATAVPIPLN